MSFFGSSDLTLEELVTRADHILVVRPPELPQQLDPAAWSQDGGPFQVEDPVRAEDPFAAASRSPGPRWSVTEYKVVESLTGSAGSHSSNRIEVRESCWRSKASAQEIEAEGGSVWAMYPQYQPSAKLDDEEERILFLLEAEGIYEFVATDSYEACTRAEEIRRLIAERPSREP